MANLAPNGYGASIAKTIRELTGANTVELDGAPDEGLVWFSSRGGVGSNQDIANATADIAGKVRISSLPTSGDPIAIATTDTRALPTVSATLPTNPVDGQMWIYRGSNFTWQFIYNASSSSAYKWECIGGGPNFANNTTDQTVAIGTTLTGLTSQAALTLPFAGDYQVGINVVHRILTAGRILECTAAIINGSTGAVDAGSTATATANSTSATTYWMTASRIDTLTNPSPGGILKVIVKQDSGTVNVNVARHGVFALPIRVG